MSIPETYSLGVDIGGTHISCAAVRIETGALLPHTHARATYNHTDAADVILQSWAKALNETLAHLQGLSVKGIGFAIPGPFEYLNGVSKMQHKFLHLYDLHIPTLLRPLLKNNTSLNMRFINDATAFAVGEAWVGEGKGCKKVVVGTLGTGFGSAFIDEGVPVVSGDTVPNEGCLWHLPFKDGIADHYFSTGWFTKTYQERSGKTVNDVRTLVQAEAHDPIVRQMFDEFGANLAECLGPWLQRFDAEILILGGNISQALPLFADSFAAAMQRQGLKTRLTASRLLENAALIGSARLLDEGYWEKASKHIAHI